MANRDELVDLAVKHIQERIDPKIKLIRKDKSFLMKLINIPLFLLTGGAFMTRFWTTIGKTIYAPTGDMSRGWAVVFHEAIHVRQHNKEGLFHSLLYLSPQILAIPAILVLLLAGAGLFSLLGFLFLLPWPAYFRYKKELEGYKISLAAVEFIKPGLGTVIVDYTVDNFTGPNYFFMWPFRNRVKKELEKHIFEIQNSYDLDRISDIDREMYDCLMRFMIDNQLMDQRIAERYEMLQRIN